MKITQLPVLASLVIHLALISSFTYAQTNILNLVSINDIDDGGAKFAGVDDGGARFAGVDDGGAKFAGTGEGGNHRHRPIC